MSLAARKIVLGLRRAILRFLQRLDGGSLARKHFWFATSNLSELDACSLAIPATSAVKANEEVIASEP